MDGRPVDVELYEEVIDDVGRFSTPTGSRSSSPSGVDKRSQTPAQSAFQEPTYYAEIANDGQSVTRISDPAELATSCRIPQLQTDSVQKTPVATTLPPEHGARMLRLQHETSDTSSRLFTTPLRVQENYVSREPVNDRPSSAPVYWMTAITDRVNAL